MSHAQQGISTDQNNETKVKRKGGQTKDDAWLVLTESQGEEGIGYTHSCGQQILVAQVFHPIWDGPFPCSGGGQCKLQEVPYCPECEEKPQGSPIEIATVKN